MAEYIEREALPQKKERGFFLDDYFNAGWNACLNNIEAIPAADVVPVRHGRWIYNEKSMAVCSICGNTVAFVSNPNSKWEFGHYCPNCGALMMVNADVPTTD